MKATTQKTTLMKVGQLQPKWHTVDVNGQILGRAASQIAMLLMGKHRPQYTPNVDTGDFVIVTNAEKVRLSGKKAETKEYDYYTYHIGGRRVVSYKNRMADKPEQIITDAVRRMLPKNKLGRKMLSKLKVYTGGSHPHAAQNPQDMKLN